VSQFHVVSWQVCIEIVATLSRILWSICDSRRKIMLQEWVAYPSIDDTDHPMKIYYHCPLNILLVALSSFFRSIKASLCQAILPTRELMHMSVWTTNQSTSLEDRMMAMEPCFISWEVHALGICPVHHTSPIHHCIVLYAQSNDKTPCSSGIVNWCLQLTSTRHNCIIYFLLDQQTNVSFSVSIIIDYFSCLGRIS